MKTTRRAWFSILADTAIRMGQSAPIGEELRRAVSRDALNADTRRWPLRMTEFLRNRLRSRWLRLRREIPQGNESVNQPRRTPRAQS